MSPEEIRKAGRRLATLIGDPEPLLDHEGDLSDYNDYVAVRLGLREMAEHDELFSCLPQREQLTRLARGRDAFDDECRKKKQRQESASGAREAHTKKADVRVEKANAIACNLSHLAEHEKPAAVARQMKVHPKTAKRWLDSKK